MVQMFFFFVSTQGNSNSHTQTASVGLNLCMHHNPQVECNTAQ